MFSGVIDSLDVRIAILVSRRLHDCFFRYHVRVFNTFDGLDRFILNNAVNFSCFYSSENRQFLLLREVSHSAIKELVFSFLRSDVEWQWELPGKKLNMNGCFSGECDKYSKEDELEWQERTPALHGDSLLTCLDNTRKNYGGSAPLNNGSFFEMSMEEIDSELLEVMAVAKTKNCQSVSPVSHDLQLNMRSKLRKKRFAPNKRYSANMLSIETSCA